MAIYNILKTLPNLDYISKLSCVKFEQDVLNNDTFCEFKIQIAGMRLGKTYLMIRHNIPFLLMNTDTKIAIVTSPISAPIVQNEYVLQNMCAEYGFISTANIKHAKEALEDGKKVVMYVTNQLAYVMSEWAKFYNYLIDNNIDYGIFGDECWTWNIPEQALVNPVSGNPNTPEYKATWYKLMSNVLSVHSKYTYGYTATETLMHDQTYKPSDGKMKYNIISNTLNPQAVSHRLAWFGNAVFYTDKASVCDNPTKDEAFAMLITSIQQHIKKFGYKRTAYIQCNDTYSEETLKKVDKDGKQIYHNVDTVELVKERIINSNYVCELDEYIGAVLSSTGCYLFNKNGERKSVPEDLVYDKMDDEDDPLVFAVSVDMGKTGTTIRTLKEFFSFRKTNKINPDYGAIVYGTNQGEGRTLTPNCGLTVKDLYTKYGGSFHNVPTFPKEINTCNFYLLDNPMMRQSIEVFKRDFCPTYEDFMQSLDDKVCPTCGRSCSCNLISDEELKFQTSTKKLNKVLGIKQPKSADVAISVKKSKKVVKLHK